MLYQDVVRDFALRTRTNLERLELIQKHESDKEFYEVTQLINSLLGLLVFPQQQYFNEIPKISIGELADQGWPIPRVQEPFSQVSDLQQLMRYFRNAVAHFNIKFMNDYQGQVCGLIVWNKNRNQAINWKAEFSIQDLRKFIYKFIELILEEQQQKF